jgi:hypothetical protein
MFRYFSSAIIVYNIPFYFLISRCESWKTLEKTREKYRLKAMRGPCLFLKLVGLQNQEHLEIRQIAPNQSEKSFKWPLIAVNQSNYVCYVEAN